MQSTCEGIVMQATCDSIAKKKWWRIKDINLAQCEGSGWLLRYNLWLKSSRPSRPPATCTPCPALQTFDDDSYALCAP